MSDHNAVGNDGPKASRPVLSNPDEKDLPEAARIVRLAFGTFRGAPDPDTSGPIATTSMAATPRLMSLHSPRRRMEYWSVPTLPPIGEASASSA